MGARHAALALLALVLGWTAPQPPRTLEVDAASGRVRVVAGVEPSPAAVSWALVRYGGEQENHGSLEGLSLPEGEGEGVVVVGVDFAPDAEGSRADEAQAVRRVESAALVVRRGGEGPDGVATAKLGLAVEIRPLMDPTALLSGSTLPVRLYVEGAAAGGAIVEALSSDGETQTSRADRDGIAHVEVDRAGRWRLAVRRVVAGNGLSTEFVGTLAFEVSR